LDGTEEDNPWVAVRGMSKTPGNSQPILVKRAVFPARDAVVAAAPARVNQLRRSFRARDGVALIVSNVIGVGIFTTPAIIARNVPEPGVMLALWVIGGCLALAGAMSYAQLGRRWPAAGGEYIYLSRAYGPTAGFLSGWTSLIAGFSGAVAASAVGLVAYLGRYFPALASDHGLFSINFYVGSFTVSPRALGAAFVILAFALLHACNLGAGKLTQSMLALFIILIIGAFCVFGFTLGTGSWSHFHSVPFAWKPSSWLLAFLPIMFSYSGWNAACYISEEMYDTRRSIGPALLAGTCVIVALYVVLNALYLYAVPAAEIKGAVNVGDVAARALFGVGGNVIAPVMSAFTVVALLGCISAMTIAGPRVYFAMSRDGAFIPSFAHTSARFGTPTLAIGLQAFWSIMLVMTGSFEQILNYTGFTILLSSGAAASGLFVARRRELRSQPKLWLGMIAPAIFVVACAAIVVNTVWGAPKTALLGCLLIAAGLPVFYWSRRRRPATDYLALSPIDDETPRLVHRSMPE
jgi:basic amino acid/polyamine antiporter, APA family